MSTGALGLIWVMVPLSSLLWTVFWSSLDRLTTPTPGQLGTEIERLTPIQYGNPSVEQILELANMAAPTIQYGGPLCETCLVKCASSTLISVLCPAGLQHENIVRVHECLGPDGASLEGAGPDLHAVYIVQELLDTDLHCIIQSGQLTEQHVQFFLYQVRWKALSRSTHT